MEVVTGRRRRQNWPGTEKARIVAESLEPDANISEVARRNGVSRGLLTVWRRLAREALVIAEEPALFTPVRVTNGGEHRESGVVASEAQSAANGVERDRGHDRGRDDPGAGGRRRGHIGGIDHGAASKPMISFDAQRRVFVSTRPVDFRKGVHGLVALVATALGGDPYSGDVFVFRAKRNDRLKLLFFDGSGMVLATKWLEESGFAWPPIEDGAMSLTPTQFAMLFDGFSEWMRVAPKAVKRPRKTA